MKRGDRVEWDWFNGTVRTGRITGMEGRHGPRIHWDDEPKGWSGNVHDWERRLAEGELRVIPK